GSSSLTPGLVRDVHTAGAEARATCAGRAAGRSRPGWPGSVTRAPTGRRALHPEVRPRLEPAHPAGRPTAHRGARASGGAPGGARERGLVPRGTAPHRPDATRRTPCPLAPARSCADVRARDPDRPAHGPVDRVPPARDPRDHGSRAVPGRGPGEE